MLTSAPLGMRRITRTTCNIEEVKNVVEEVTVLKNIVEEVTIVNNIIQVVIN